MISHRRTTAFFVEEQSGPLLGCGEAGARAAKRPTTGRGRRLVLRSAADRHPVQVQAESESRDARQRASRSRDISACPPRAKETTGDGAGRHAAATRGGEQLDVDAGEGGSPEKSGPDQQFDELGQLRISDKRKAGPAAAPSWPRPKFDLDQVKSTWARCFFAGRRAGPGKIRPASAS